MNEREKGNKCHANKDSVHETCKKKDKMVNLADRQHHGDAAFGARSGGSIGRL